MCLGLLTGLSPRIRQGRRDGENTAGVAHHRARSCPLHPAAGEGYVTPDTWERIESGARRVAQKHLDVLLQTARKAGLRVTTVLEEGSAAGRIVRAARRKRVDLLVLGTHGRTGLARASWSERSTTPARQMARS